MVIINVSKFHKEELEIISSNSEEKNTISRSYSIDGVWYLIVTTYTGGWYASLSNYDNHILSAQESVDMIQKISAHEIVPECSRIGMNQLPGSKVIHFYPQSQYEQLNNK